MSKRQRGAKGNIRNAQRTLHVDLAPGSALILGSQAGLRINSASWWFLGLLGLLILAALCPPLRFSRLRSSRLGSSRLRSSRAIARATAHHGRK